MTRRHVKTDRPVNRLSGLRVRSESAPAVDKSGAEAERLAARRRILDAVEHRPFKRGHVECPLGLGRLNFLTYRGTHGVALSAKCQTKNCLDWSEV